jgi:hypothetical protein
VRIRRFLGIDAEGILTIGMTTHLDQRRRQFISGHSNGHGHSAANLLFPLRKERRHKHFLQPATFQIAFEPVSNREEARAREAMLTCEYWKRYGEAPPLTSAMGDRYANFRTSKS